MEQQLKRLLPRHYIMIELALSGLSNKAISQKLGCGENSVCMVLNSPVSQQELARRRKGLEDTAKETHAQGINRVKDILSAGAVDAANSMVSLARSAQSESVRRASCADILDRATDTGVKAGGVVNITAENLLLLQVAIRESDEVAAA